MAAYQVISYPYNLLEDSVTVKRFEAKEEKEMSDYVRDLKNKNRTYFIVNETKKNTGNDGEIIYKIQNKGAYKMYKRILFIGEMLLLYFLVTLFLYLKKRYL